MGEKGKAENVVCCREAQAWSQKSGLVWVFSCCLFSVPNLCLRGSLNNSPYVCFVGLPVSLPLQWELYEGGEFVCVQSSPWDRVSVYSVSVFRGQAHHSGEQHDG